MNAQEKWKARYKRLRNTRSARNKRMIKTSMRVFSREAALERIIARQAREIAAMRAELNERDESEALRDKLEWG